jgi:pyruvate/2-oxoglutarate dehydrogenase complex dihydrolipoamide dehydrogenase (E3) component
MQRFDFDIAIVGGGSAGYAAARTTANAGLKTVVIEGGEEVGGLCILRGCMPTKALLYNAEVAHLVKNSALFGVRTGKISFDFKKAMARKNLLIKDFADYRVNQLRSGTFEFIRANAKFLDAHTLALTSLNSEPLSRQRPGLRQLSAAVSSVTVRGKAPEDWRTPKPGGNFLTAKNFVIATGSAVAPSPLCQLNDLECLTSDSALALKKLPKSLIVLGGGPTACEFAQFFARFGVKVTVIQRSPHILHDFDADAAAVVENVFRREGIRLFTGTKLVGAKRKGKMKTVKFECKGKVISVSAEEILFALGRIPNTESLDLKNAGVKTERGRILCNEFMQTSAPHIYAAGDCAGPYEIVHIAVQQGEIAGRNVAASNGGASVPASRADYRLLISIVFTEPQMAFVGLTEKEAGARGVSFLAASYPFNDHGKSLIMNATDGFVKLLANPETGEIIGGECVGPLGGELIHEIAAAMAKQMTVQELAAMPHYHPTLAEIWTYPAEELAKKIG